jgi:peptidoglycan hydrolase CwlO-like protein
MFQSLPSEIQSKVEKVRSRLMQVEAERDRYKAQVASLKNTIDGLTSVCGAPPPPPPSSALAGYAQSQ